MDITIDLYSDKTELMKAVALNDMNSLFALLSDGNVDLFAKDSKGRTALDWARICKNELAIAVLMKAMEKVIKETRSILVEQSQVEIELRSRNEYQRNEVRQAIERKDCDRILAVLRRNELFRDIVETSNQEYFVDVCSNDGDTALILAAGFNSVLLLEMLLEMNVDVNHQNHLGHSALTWGAVCGHGEIIRKLLVHGADPLLLSPEGRTVLHFACLHSKPYVVGVIFEILFKRFASYRDTHSIGKIDPKRWITYADFMNEFLEIRDKFGCRAVDLIAITPPTEESENDTNIDLNTTAATNSSSVTDHNYKNANIIEEFIADMDPSSSMMFTMTNILQSSNDFMIPANQMEEFDPLEPMKSQSVSATAQIHNQHNEDMMYMDKSTLFTHLDPELRDEFIHSEIETNLEIKSHISTDVIKDTQELYDANYKDSRINMLEYSSQFHENQNKTFKFISNSKDVNVLVTLFEQAQQHIQRWRETAIYEESLLEPVSCWNGCGYTCKFEHMFAHTTDNCPFRPVQCATCLLPFHACDIRKHELSECSRRKVACPNSIEGCRALLPYGELEQHITLRCPRRKILCRLNCDLKIAFEDRDAHETMQCKNRRMTCDKCHQGMQAKDYRNHVREDCPERLVKCTVSCGLRVRLGELESHVNQVCCLPCRWDCGEKIGPLERRRLHELNDCPSRICPCRNGCGLQGLKAFLQQEHEAYQCSLATVCCPFSCGSDFIRSKLPLHVHPFRGQCLERPVRCPSNWVGWKVLVDGEEGLILQYRRFQVKIDDTGKEILSTDIPNMKPQEDISPSNVLEGMISVGINEESTNKSNKSESTKEVDRLYVRFEHGHRWVNIWGSNISPIEKIAATTIGSSTHGMDAGHICGWIPYSELGGHLESVCPNRPVWLRGNQEAANGQSEKVKKLPVIEENLILAVNGNKQYGKARKKLIRKTSADSNLSISSSTIDFRKDGKKESRNVVDPAVRYNGTVQNVISHFMDESAKENNSETKLVEEGEYPVFCQVIDESKPTPAPDSRIIARMFSPINKTVDFIGQRTTYEKSINLAKKIVDMTDFEEAPPSKSLCQFCSIEIVKEDMDRHIRKTCVQVIIRCPNGCGLQLERRDVSVHIDICPKRLISCEKCNVQIWAEELEKHNTTACYNRETACPYGCGTSGLFSRDLDAHMKNDCQDRPWTCKCGCVTTHRNMSVHKIVDCPLKEDLCPQGCGLTVTRDALDHHLERECANKHLFYNRLENCPLNCGSRMARKDILEHVTNACKNRLTSCPSGCGNTFKVNRLNTHLLMCPKRQICCQFNMNPCKRPLHMWFYKPELLGGDDDSDEDTVQNARVVSRNRRRSVARVIAGLADDQDDEDSVGNPKKNARKASQSSYSKASKATLSLTSYGKVGNDAITQNHQPWVDTGRSSLSEDSIRMAAKPYVEDALTQMNSTLKATLQSPPKPHHDLNDEPSRRLNIDDMTKIITPTLHISRSRKSTMYEIRENKSTAIYMEDGQMNFRENLRMIPCLRHGATALMYAVRSSEGPLLEYILWLTQGEDIDLESNSGDTALTLACFSGKLNFVEMLLENGADMNIETESGRTALIEATRRGNLAIVDALIKAGANVTYKTRKHNKSATGWARQMGFTEILRSLELGAVVQKQLSLIFLAIGCGDLDKVKAMIGDGDPYDPNNSYRLHQQMEKYFGLVKVAEGEVKQAEEALNSIRSTVGESEAAANAIQAEVDRAKHHLESITVHLHNKRSSVTNLFQRFERAVEHLHPADLEEIARLRQKDELILTAILASGIALGFLPVLKQGQSYSTHPSHLAAWYPVMENAFRDPASLIRRMQKFSWNSLQGHHEHSKTRVAMLHDLCDEMRHLLAQKKHIHHMYDVVRKPQNLPRFKGLVQSVIEEKREEAVVSDEDWDSDADDAGDGEWVKGEWVPRTPRKKKDWYERRKKANKPPSETSNKLLLEGSSRNLKSSEDSERKTEEISKKMEAENVEEQSSRIVSIEKVPIRQHNVKNISRHVKASILPGENNEITTDTKTPTDPKKAIDIKRAPSSEIKKSNTVKRINAEEEVVVVEEEDVVHEQFVDCIMILLNACEEQRKNVDLIRSVDDRVIAARLELNELTKKAYYVKQKARTDRSAEVMVEKDLTQKLKYSRGLLKRANQYREKLRITRLLNQVSPSGHTALSLAASYGFFEAYDLMLIHGSSVSFTDDYMHTSVSLIQISYRLKSVTKEFKKAEREGKLDVEDEKNSSGKLIERMFELKTQRSRLVRQLKYRRRNHRLALPEAAYSGRWEIVHRTIDRKLYFVNACYTWIPPCLPAPIRKPTRKLKKGQKLDLMECLLYGVRDYAVGAYSVMQGWVGACDPMEPYGEALEKITPVWNEVLMKRERSRADVIRMLQVNQEVNRQNEAKDRLEKAIARNDFRECMQIVMDSGCSIDYETENGTTALIVAAEENVAGDHHTYVKNDDGDEVLAVEYLLDRIDHRPAVNLETSLGVTALSHASSLGRGDCMDALISRGAGINYSNKFGSTALHAAASNGAILAVRMLIERGADINAKDNNGKTPFDLAEENGLSEMMGLISQLASGNLGLVVLKRGQRISTVTCVLGCGETVNSGEMKKHVSECPLRIIDCPNDCGETLLAKNLGDHLEETCLNKSFICESCNEEYYRKNTVDHHANLCAMRIVNCPFGCDSNLYAKDLEKHVKLCEFRVIPCPEECGEKIQYRNISSHRKTDCIYRQISCPLKCCTLMLYREKDDHVMNICQLRPVSCKWCRESRPYLDNIDHEEICSERSVLCPQKCGNVIPVKELKGHISSSCSHRFVPCEQGCELKVRVVDMSTHVTNECGHRFIPCPRGCRNPNDTYEIIYVMARELDTHLKKYCDERMIKCSLCQNEVVAKGLKHHKTNECLEREIECRQEGCSKRFPFSKIDYHERYECRRRDITCPQGCREVIPSLSANKHMTKECAMRYELCPLKCGVNIRFKDKQKHVDHECIRRVRKNRHGLQSSLQQQQQQQQSSPRNALHTPGSRKSSRTDPMSRQSSALTRLGSMGSSFSGNSEDDLDPVRRNFPTPSSMMLRMNSGPRMSTVLSPALTPMSSRPSSNNGSVL